jgi:hypothetical protein
LLRVSIVMVTEIKDRRMQNLPQIISKVMEIGK